VSLHQLGRYGVGWLLDILRSYPGELTTVIPRSTIDHLTPGINTSRYIGLHYDQQILRPDGWAERLPMGKRLQAGRRIVVNVGIGRRVAVTALYFSAFQFARMFAPHNPGYLPRTNDLVCAMRSRPDLLATMALVHMIIYPGEVAEISPANSAHDGSMLDCDKEATALIFSMGRSPIRF
jgi:hypothetical protein